jgi:hypothetical protein
VPGASRRGIDRAGVLHDPGAADSDGQPRLVCAHGRVWSITFWLVSAL